MDLADYERAKFELAAILRSASVKLRHADPKAEVPFTDLFSRLAEDRFNLVVVGRFNRGKSSLMNAMLRTERLPTGIVPLTSVITTVRYGSSERAFIEHEGWRLAQEIQLAELPDYVTQDRNPGNQKRVSFARVELPCELLRRGFHFVDTPGLGSSIIENTRTTEGFLPEADAFMLVTSYDSPLAEEELRILRGVSSSPGRVFLIVNKHDIVSASERAQVLSHVREQASRAFADSALRIFSVSAREAIDATKMNDSERFNRSGVAALEEELIRYLLEEKQSAFLMRMSERIFEALSRVPDAAEEIGLLQSFTSKRIHSKPTEANRSFAIGPPATPEGERFDACPICEFIEQGMYEFLCTYQYAVATDRSTQTQLAERGGLCAFHIWHYASVSSPHGTCVGFAGLFEYLAKCLREISTRSRTEIEAHAVRSLRPTTATCSLCLKQSELEAGAVARTAQIIQQERARKKRLSVAVCLPHLELVAAALGDDSAAGELLRKEADVSERMAEDMRRYALKQEGLRQYLASDEELHANYRALVLLGGHRNVHGLRKRT